MDYLYPKPREALRPGVRTFLRSPPILPDSARRAWPLPGDHSAFRPAQTPTPEGLALVFLNRLFNGVELSFSDA